MTDAMERAKAERNQRIQKQIDTLKEMRDVMLAQENWENLKRFIDAVTYGGMALGKLLEKEDE